MSTCLAFVLGGGGARGAMQVGALRALVEAGFRPDLMVGSSIGALNAVALALHGVDSRGIEALEQAFETSVGAKIVDAHLVRTALRAVSQRTYRRTRERMRDLLISQGVGPDLRFGQITSVRLAVIGADLDTGAPVIYGQDPSASVLEGVLASIALPPWFAPIEKDGHTILDGGALSNVPIEPALTMGATQIIALDLDDPRAVPRTGTPVVQFLAKLSLALRRRQTYLEAALAEARGVPVRCIELRSPQAALTWEFDRYRELIPIGYAIARQAIAEWTVSS